MNLGYRLHQFAGLRIDLVSDEPFESPDVDGLIHLTPVAGDFTGVVANPTADAGEWVVHLDHPHGVGPAALMDEGDVALSPLPGRAGIPARGDAELLDGEAVGHRLGVQLEGCPARGQPLVEDVGHRDRAHLDTIAAADTRVNIDVARMVLHLHRVATDIPGDVEHLGVCHQLDVGVATGLHQLGRDGAHRTVVGGEGLVELCHLPADGRLGLDEIHLETLLREVERGLHARDAPSDDHHRSDWCGDLAVGGVDYRIHMHPPASG